MAANLKDNSEHCKLCHERWRQRINRKTSSFEYKDEWYQQQCGMCIYFITLSGCLSTDYGVCSNPVSEFDGIVKFEHDGCGHYSEADEWAR